jgi:hypothetical protein
MKAIMYLGLVTAIPSKNNKDFKQGSAHAILVFVKAENFERANALAEKHLKETGWQDVVIDKMNPVDNKAVQQAQPELQEAYSLAERDGSHAMVLDKPV